MIPYRGCVRDKLLQAVAVDVCSVLHGSVCSAPSLVGGFVDGSFSSGGHVSRAAECRDGIFRKALAGRAAGAAARGIERAVAGGEGVHCGLHPGASLQVRLVLHGRGSCGRRTLNRKTTRVNRLLDTVSE